MCITFFIVHLLIHGMPFQIELVEDLLLGHMRTGMCKAKARKEIMLTSSAYTQQLTKARIDMEFWDWVLPD